MLSEEDDVEIHALARRGWSVSAIARHTGRDRKTVRRYLAGERPSREPAPSCLERFRPYLEARFEDDAHVLARTLYGELVELGFERSYPTLVRELRRLELRPVCECCRAGGVKLTIGLEHEPGEELQLDWLELRETPWGAKAFVLVGALSHSGRARGYFSDGQSFPHLAEALDGLLRRFCAALLAAGEPVLVFPGGAREVYKRRNQRYQLLWGNRVGFARIAIAARCPVIPFGAVGAEDRFQVLLDTDQRVAAPVRAVIRYVAGRDDVGTLLVRGSGPVGLPRPDRLYFRFGAPIRTTRWGGRADDPEAVAECRDLVKAEIKSHFHYLLALRDSDPRRRLLPRPSMPSARWSRYERHELRR